MFVLPNETGRARAPSSSLPRGGPIERRRLNWFALLAFLGICLAVGAAGSAFTPVVRSAWYQTLPKPDWTPPPAVFAPAWTALYLLMGVAAWLVWRRRGFGGAAVPFALFAAQLALNFCWTAIFFGLRAPAAAFAEIVVLLALIVATVVAFWRVRPLAGALLLPYLLWTSFAAALNFAIWRMS